MRLSLALALLPCLAYSQTYAHGLNQCAREFYDPKNYHWISYENICEQAIHITLVGASKLKPFTSGVDLKPGQHDGPGLSADEVKSYGGLTAYVCPAGFFAVDAADRRIVLKVVDQFTCKK